MEVIEIHNNEKHIAILKTFLDNLGEAKNSFRYYNSRSLETINNHILTILVIENNLPIGYGHLDEEENIVWLGISVIPKYHNKGIGKLIMSYLVSKAQKLKISNIFLTVDIHNKPAQILYEKFNFKRINETKTYLKYNLALKND